MSYYGSFGNMPRGTEVYTCNCVEGHCSGCGECCSDLLPLTDAELRTLKDYAQRHRLREHRKAPFFDRGAVDFTCPFRNEAERKCEVYSVRPQICRAFICSKDLRSAEEDRDLISQHRSSRSLRWEIFGNDETVKAVAGAFALAAAQM